MTTHNCPSCDSGHCDLFYEARGVPTNSRLTPTRAEAVAVRRGDVALAFCDGCGLVFNAAFDPRLSNDAGVYEETHSYSSTYRTFQHRLAEQMVERFALRGKDILEIGCGTGEFLRLVCACGNNNGIAIDPGYAPDHHATRDGRTLFGREAFTETSVIAPTDLVYSNMLGRITDPAGFVALLRVAVVQRKDARLLLQVPDIVRTLKNFAFWEFNYGRFSYFSPITLSLLLRARGFTVGDLWTDFDGQYLMADARADADGAAGGCPRAMGETVEDLEHLVLRFSRECPEKHAMWCELLREIARAGHRTAIWGAGSKAVSFLTTLAVGDEVGYVVDVNPHRQGKYTPGTGHRIVAPDEMAAARPDVLIVTNSACALEIQELVTSVGCAPTLLIA